MASIKETAAQISAPGGCIARSSQRQRALFNPPAPAEFSHVSAYRLLATALGVAVTHHRAEPSLVLCRSYERADHSAVVSRGAVFKYVQPEVIAALIDVTPQVSEVLREHERPVVFRLLERCVVGDHAHYRGATLRRAYAAVVGADQTRAFAAQINA
jgi:hypothetical protein